MKKAVKQSTISKIISILSIILTLVSIVSFVLIVRANNAVERSHTQRYDLTYNANRFMNGSGYLTDEVRAYAATGENDHYDNYWNEINNLKNRDIGVAKLQEIGITPDEQKLIDEMSSLSNNLVPREEEAMRFAAEGNMDEALEMVYGQAYEDTIDKIKATQAQFLNRLDVRSGQAIDDALARSAQYRIMMFLSLFLVTAIQVCSIFFMQVQVMRPIIRIKEEMELLSGGNLASKFDLTADTSEIGSLVASIHQMKKTLSTYINDISAKLQALADGDMTASVEMEYVGDFSKIRDSLATIFSSLNQVMGEISVSSGQVTSASGQVSLASQNMSGGASEQASSIEEFNAAIDEFAAGVRANAGNAETGLQDCQNSRDVLNRCTESMQSLLQAMVKMKDSSANMAKIIKVIDDIAFQTNILALNAAVEAARAGQHGKGFAVVADEVRNLATKSANAAKETSALIEADISIVGSSSEIVHKTNEELAVAGEASLSSARVMEEINNACQKQISLIDGLSSAIDQISSVVQRNAATAEETAASSEEMSAQADILNQLIGRFRMNRG